MDQHNSFTFLQLRNAPNIYIYILNTHLEREEILISILNFEEGTVTVRSGEEQEEGAVSFARVLCVPYNL